MSESRSTIFHSPTSVIGLIGFPLELDLDFLELRLPRCFLSLFALSSAIKWRITAAVSTTTCGSGVMATKAAGERAQIECGVGRGV